MKLAGILLAAGHSRRFGSEDKLLATLGGKALVRYPAQALRALQPALLIGVARVEAVRSQLKGFELVAPEHENPSQADSLRTGIAAARDRGATHALVVLGDMPFVTTEVMAHVVARCDDDFPSAVTDGARRMPPACFPASLFDDLITLAGDHGATSLLRQLTKDRLVPVPTSQLQDIDTPDQLRLANSASAENT